MGSSEAAKSEALVIHRMRGAAKGKCQEIRLEKLVGGRSGRNLCLMLSILDFNLHSLGSIEGHLRGLICTFKRSLWLLSGEWNGEGRSGSETHLENNHW